MTAFSVLAVLKDDIKPEDAAQTLKWIDNVAGVKYAVLVGVNEVYLDQAPKFDGAAVVDAARDLLQRFDVGDDLEASFARLKNLMLNFKDPIAMLPKS